MSTFAELGIEFPLFAGPVEDAAEWCPTGVCIICDEQREGFHLGVGDDLIVTCPSCGSATAVAADDGEAPCLSCGQAVVLNEFEDDHACWRCLRSGRWASTMDTEAGMIRWQDAMAGRSHGLPFPAEPKVWAIGDEGADAQADARTPVVAGFATTEANEDGWRGVLIPSEMMLELTRTPSYSTWQGENWLFHCQRPMRYIGRWGREQFDAEAPDGDGMALAIAVADFHEDAWTHGLAAKPSANSAVTAYMFGCPACEAVRGHWDVD